MESFRILPHPERGLSPEWFTSEDEAELLKAGDEVKSSRMRVEIFIPHLASESS